MFPNATVGTCVFLTFLFRPRWDLSWLVQWRYTPWHHLLVLQLDFLSAGALAVNLIVVLVLDGCYKFHQWKCQLEMDILYSHHLVIPPNSCPDLRRFSSRLVLVMFLKVKPVRSRNLHTCHLKVEGAAVCQSGVAIWPSTHSELYSLRKTGENEHCYAPLEKTDIGLGRSIFVSCYKPFSMYALIFLRLTQLNPPQNFSLNPWFSWSTFGGALVHFVSHQSWRRC